jgi:hypothetical protein
MSKLKSYSSFLYFLPIVILAGIPNYAWYWDGIEFSWAIENDPVQACFHPHHLIFTPFFKAIYFMTEGIGLNLTALQIMVCANIIFGLIFLFFCYKIFKKLFPDSRDIVVQITLITAFSYTFASHFRNTSTYLIPITLLIIIIYRVYASTQKGLKISNIDWLLLLIATMFHQVSILALPALAFAQYHSSESNRLSLALKYFAGFVIVSLLFYFLVFLTFVPKEVIDFPKWIVAYSTKKFWVFSDFQGLIPTILKSLYQGLLSHKALFLAPVDRGIVFPYGYKFSPFAWYAGFYSGWILFVAGTGLMIYGIKCSLLDLHYRLKSLFLIVWIVPFLLFFQFFTPYQSFYRMFYLAPLMIFIITASGNILKFQKKGSLLLPLIVLWFIAHNLIFGLIPDANPSNNPYLVDAKDLKKITNERDLILCFPDLDYQKTVYMRYFSNRDVFSVRHFKPITHPDIAYEEYWDICTASQNWIKKNYDHIYLSEGLGRIPKDYLRIVPTFKQQDPPPLILLFLPQIYILETIETSTGSIFNRIELYEYEKHPNLDPFTNLK